jgi:hypothetical protein
MDGAHVCMHKFWGQYDVIARSDEATLQLTQIIGKKELPKGLSEETSQKYLSRALR